MGIYGYYNTVSIVEFFEFLAVFYDFLLSKQIQNKIDKISSIHLINKKLEQK